MASIDKTLQDYFKDLKRSINSATTEANTGSFDFNHREAEATRRWQSEMSATAHQREVADLRRAGLNPVLSANTGAMSYTGASASANAESGAGALGSLSGIMSSLAGLKSAEIQSSASKEVAKINASASEKVAATNSAASKYSADKHYAASKYGSDTSYKGTVYGADKSYAGTKYSADSSKAASKYSSDMSKSASKYSADTSKEASKYSADTSAAAAKYSADRSAEASRIVATINSGATRYSADMAYKAQMDKPQSNLWSLLDKHLFNNNGQVLADISGYAGKKLFNTVEKNGNSTSYGQLTTRGRVAASKLCLAAGAPVTPNNLQIAGMYLNNPNSAGATSLMNKLKSQNGKKIKTLSEMDKEIAKMYPNTQMY